MLNFVGAINSYLKYISSKMRSSALVKAYLWSSNDGKASWIIRGRQGHRQGTKPVSGKIAIFLIILLVKKFTEL